jgi:hypothetical protein
MPTVALITEGRTDNEVLFQVLRGFFGADFDKESVTYVQPPPAPQGAHAGWGLVLAALSEGRSAEALGFNDYLVVQIDTDVCDREGFDISRRTTDANGTPRERTPAELREAVREHLVSLIGPSFEAHKDRIFFAICVDAMECWLLPLVTTNHPGKTKGCLEAVDKALRQANLPTLNKDPRHYAAVAKPFAKKKELDAAAKRVESLRLLLEELEHAAPPVDPFA